MELNETALALITTASVLVIGLDRASAEEVVPISGSGFSVDLIAEKSGDSPVAVTDSAVFARWVHVEEGAPNSNHPGFPSGGLFVSTKPGFETEFQLQPFDQANHLLNGDTFTLDTPASYQDLRFLMPGIGGRTADNFRATVNFTDGSSTDLVTSVSDWQASQPYNAADRMAIVRDSWDAGSYFPNGIFPRQLDFTLSPEDQLKPIGSIAFTLLDRMGVAAISGTSTLPATPFVITAVDYSPDTDEVTLTWTSNPGATYAVRYSTNLASWDGDLDDSVEADDGEQTTRTFRIGGLASDDGELFFRVERN